MTLWGNLSIWLRVIRVRLLTASLVAVTNGLAISWAFFHVLNVPYALLTYAGVLSLHASVDILNDYFDFKNKIDLMTKGTPFSGGTRVLPEGLLDPKSVYRLGMFFLVAGALIGIFFTIELGALIGGILLFAVLATYFYSTKVVRSGLGETFLVIKGILIVLGTFYVQTKLIQLTPIYVGLILGLMSSSVVFVNEFPDYIADKVGGRKNIVVVMGVSRAAKFYAVYPLLAVSLGLVGVALKLIPYVSLIGIFAAIPFFVRTFRTLELNPKIQDSSEYIPAMADNVLGARILGVAFVLSYIISGFGLP